jgi:hypothetical protein
MACYKNHHVEFKIFCQQNLTLKYMYFWAFIVCILCATIREQATSNPGNCVPLYFYCPKLKFDLCIAQILIPLPTHWYYK